MGWDTTDLAEAFLLAYADVLGRPPRDNCEKLDRCQYDRSCPWYDDCILTDYSE
jgi:hypothetical protein